MRVTTGDDKLTAGSGMAAVQLLVDGLLERPDPVLDEALNAASACFVRHGLAHTSVRDIAAELGVSKATVYRQVGPVDDLARMLLAREVHRLLDTVSAAVGQQQGADAVLEIVTSAAEFICGHALVRKILTDEPDLVAELLGTLPLVTSSITGVLTTIVGVVRPEAGTGSSAAVVADVAVRIVLAAVFVPPPDLRLLLSDALGPHLRT